MQQLPPFDPLDMLLLEELDTYFLGENSNPLGIFGMNCRAVNFELTENDNCIFIYTSFLTILRFYFSYTTLKNILSNNFTVYVWLSILSFGRWYFL